MARLPDVLTSLQSLRPRLRPSWRRLRQAIQTAVAAALAYLLATAFGLPQGYWAVITAMLVVQGSIGASLGLAIDRLVATLIGAAVGGTLLALHLASNEIALVLLFLAIVALAYLATFRPALRLAPVTAVIVFVSHPGDVSPLASAADRVIEIAIGAVVALATALLLFPSRAGQTLAGHVGRLLPLIADHLADSLAGALGPKRDEAALLALNGRIRVALATGDTLAVEASRELAGHLADHADPTAVLRTLRRLWNTALMAARASLAPLPAPAAARLRPSLESLAAALREYLAGLAKAFAAGADPPPLEPVLAALAAFEAAMGELRQSGITRAMAGEDVARVFTLAFALGQLRQNLADLADRCHDLHRTRTPSLAPATTPETTDSQR
jgi:uncharacterized membrane protein YccC